MAEPIIIDLSGRGGLVNKYHGDYISAAGKPELRYLIDETQYASGYVNPIKKYGYLSPINNTVRLSSGSDPNVATAATIVDPVTLRMYFFERGTDLCQLQDGLGDVGFNANRTIAGATGTDLEIYQVNGVRKLFYSYQKSGGGNIGIHDFATTFNDTWLSGTVSGAFNTGATNNVKMVVADNGFMYVLDGAAVHKIDGTTGGGANGTATANVLTFPSSFQITDGVDARGNLWISITQNTNDLESAPTSVARYSTSSGIYIWDRQTTVMKSSDFIPIDGVREIRFILSFRGVPHSFTIGANGYTQLRGFTGNEFSILRELGPSAFPRFKDSISVDSNFISWLGVDGLFYSYGRVQGEEKDGLFILGDFTTKVADGRTFRNSGAILLAGTSETVSSGDNGSPIGYYVTFDDTSVEGYVAKWFPHANSATSITPQAHAGNLYSGIKPLPRLSGVQDIVLYYPALSSLSGSSTNATLSIYFNQSSTAYKSYTVTNDDAARGYVRIPVGKKSGVNFVQLGLTWSTTNGLANCITPMYAAIIPIDSEKKL